MPQASIGCPFWMLARMVLQMRGTILPGHKWDVMVDLFFYREPEEAKDQEVDESGTLVVDFGVTEYDGAGMIANDQWGGDAQWPGDAWESAAPPVDVTVIPPAAYWD